jgi:hypothetical protein
MPDDSVPSEKPASRQRPAARRSSKRINWRKLWEEHPFRLIGGGLVGSVVASAIVTFRVCDYFWSQRLESEQKSAALNLDYTKREDQAQYDDLKSRLLSIEHRVGEKSMWDLTDMVVTPDQAKTLDKRYVYNDQIHCFLDIPASNAWSFLETTEAGLWHLLHGNAAEPSNPETSSNESQALFELGKTLKICLWRGPGSFTVQTADPQRPTICMFPYTSIEELRKEFVSAKLYPTLTKLQEALAARLQTMFTELDIQMDKVVQDYVNAFGRVPWIPPHDSPEQIRAAITQLVGSLAPNMSADPAAFWASREILSGFELSTKIPKSTFQVLNAEKKGNVFHLSERYIFPVSDKSPEIYWDQEFIDIDVGTRTILVTTSAPWSPDRRPTELAWIGEWLAGLKVPLND